MVELNLYALERMAVAQSNAYERMCEIGEGVGGLGVYHPEMFQSMHTWDDLSENNHADTVLSLIERIRELGGD